MEKSLKRENSISCCTSPGSGFFASISSFAWYDADIWTEIAKHLDGKCLVNLAMTNKWFRKIIMEDGVWKFACLRGLQLLPSLGDLHVSKKWMDIYASTFDGTHSYTHRQQEKHLDWMRIGAFSFDSPMGFVSEKLNWLDKLHRGESTERMIKRRGGCFLKNVKTGIWIADLQLVRCPVCNLDTCEGTMQILDTRHLELFLEDGYKDGTWNYEDVGSHVINTHCSSASGGIFDVEHLGGVSTADIFNFKSWVGKPGDWQPKAQITPHAVAVNTNLQQNEGLHVKYQVMRNGESGSIVSIRISQQLV